MLHLRLRPCNIAPSLKTNGLGFFFHSRAPFLPMRLPKVCLALSGDTIDDMLATAESMARDNPFLNFVWTT